MVKLEFCYDVVSPYSYLAFKALQRYREAWDLELVLNPIFLGGVMKATGNTPPAMLPARGVYMAADIARLAEWWGLTLKVPEGFMQGTLMPMRVLAAVADSQPEKLEALTEAMWQHHWGLGEKLDEAGVRTCLAACGMDPELIASAQNPVVKERLKERTEDVIDRGMFGAPAIFVEVDGEEEMYFGQDRLPLLAHRLGLPWAGPRGIPAE